MDRSLGIQWTDPAALAASARSQAGIDFLRAMRDGDLPPPPMALLLGFRLTEVEPGHVVFECTPGEQHYNPIGVVHGGYAATILDSALGCAVHTTLPAGVGYTSLGLEVKYVRPLTRDTGRVLCEGTVVYRGRRHATAGARLTAADGGKLLAHAQATLMILGGE
jgi:uncharacterized protein (TIGR00369 family)